MTLLLNKHFKDYTLLCPGIYGYQTWGTSSQDDLIKKRKNWYITNWTTGSDVYDIDDTYSEEKLNIVLETTDMDEVIRYLESKKVSKECINKILDEYSKIVEDFVEVEKWILQIN